jgi:cell division protease FtsH
VVYLFTSNAAPADLDPAIRRPGRLDVIIHFPSPDAGLRRRFIVERWHRDLAAGIDLQRVVADTDGLSFAELDEVKKQLVLRKLDTGRWDWPWVASTLRHSHRPSRRARPIGFRLGVHEYAPASV